MPTGSIIRAYSTIASYWGSRAQELRFTPYPAGAARRRLRNQAARGELRRGLPIGLVWGEADGEVRFHPDAAVTAAIRSVFDRCAERQVSREGFGFGFTPKG